MNSKGRFKAIFEYKGEFDRFPTTYYGTSEINQQIEDYLSVNSYEKLLDILGDDFRGVGPKYIGPELKNMNTQERFQAIMNFQPFDRLPIIEWAIWWDKTIDRWHQEGLPPDLTDQYDICRHFGLSAKTRGGTY